MRGLYYYLPHCLLKLDNDTKASFTFGHRHLWITCFIQGAATGQTTRIHLLYIVLWCFILFFQRFLCCFFACNPKGFIINKEQHQPIYLRFVSGVLYPLSTYRCQGCFFTARVGTHQGLNLCKCRWRFHHDGYNSQMECSRPGWLDWLDLWGFTLQNNETHFAA